MRISVITVAFNSAATISRTLRSVATQTWPDLEHLVIDGASTDGTLDVVGREGGHVARVTSEPDSGIYDAMNKGLAQATGEVIAFLNSDDHYVDADVVRTVATRMQEQDLDVVFGDVEFYDESPQQVVRRYHSGRFRPDRLAWGWIPAHPGLFVRRRVFDAVGPFSTAYRIAGDYEWMVRAFHHEPLRYEYLPQVLVKMKTGGASTSGLRATIALNREVVRACRENGVPTNMLKILSKYPLKLLEFVRR